MLLLASGKHFLSISISRSVQRGTVYPRLVLVGTTLRKVDVGDAGHDANFNYCRKIYRIPFELCFEVSVEYRRTLIALPLQRNAKDKSNSEGAQLSILERWRETVQENAAIPVFCLFPRSNH